MADDAESKALLARVDERTANIMTRLGRIEEGLKDAPTSRDMAAHDARIKALEANQSKFFWAITSAWVGGLTVVGVVSKKLLGG